METILFEQFVVAHKTASATILGEYGTVASPTIMILLALLLPVNNHHEAVMHQLTHLRYTRWCIRGEARRLVRWPRGRGPRCRLFGWRWGGPSRGWVRGRQGGSGGDRGGCGRFIAGVFPYAHIPVDRSDAACTGSKSNVFQLLGSFTRVKGPSRNHVLSRNVSSTVSHPRAIVIRPECSVLFCT